MSKILKFLTSRIFIVSALIFLQIAMIAVIMIYLSWMYIPIYVFFMAISVLIVIAIIDRNNNPMFKIAWIIPVLAFPICGALFYLMFGRTHLNKKNHSRLQKAIESDNGVIKVNEDALSLVGAKNSHIQREANYIIGSSRSNLYLSTETQFLSPGSLFFKELLIELKKAEKFIFLEYFIIGEGKMWTEILNILTDKISRGVEVRLMYDDIGCINNLSLDFPEKLRKMGIQTAVFNPYRPSLDPFLNYRDHRKFAIIDGKVAFTGGINIADEYINEKERFGFWEDASVKLTGDAVQKVTTLFLEMWYFTTGELPVYTDYIVNHKAQHDGVVIPFSDEPLFPELVCENAYLNIINDARKYVYICTPYLILDNVMESALIRAAKSGIKVVIITPHTPDKKLIFLMTRSNYKTLIDSGCEIYEFTPGFMHTKMIISDDETAIVGTSNFDYRSFYLHFENGVWMHRSKAVIQAKDSFIRTLDVSEKVTSALVDDIPFRTKLLRSILKMFAPLL